MSVELLLIITLVLTGILAGNELGTLAVIHPALDKVPYESGRPAAQSIIGRFAKFMPVLMPVTILVTVVAALALDGTQRLLLLIAAGALVLMLLITFIFLMPLNVRELRANADTPEPEWRAMRRRWMMWHSARVALDLIALVLVAAVLVGG